MNLTKTTLAAVFSTLIAGVLAVASPAAAAYCGDTPDGAPWDWCYEDEDVQYDYVTGAGRWSSVGSGGNVDEGSRSIYGHLGSEAYVKENRTGTAILRYPVDCAILPAVTTYRVTYQDDGSKARVRAKLIYTSEFYEEPRVVAKFDSNEHASSAGLTSFIGRVDDQYFSFDSCKTSALHWEVRLTRHEGGDPRLRMLVLAGQ